MFGKAFALVAVAAAAIVSSNGALAQAVDGRLKTILAGKTVKIAYRSDATPFAFLNNQRQPVGYSIDICKSVVGSLEKQFNVQGLKIEWVPVTVQTRFEAVAAGKADMECGSSTITLGRMKLVDFSNFIFVETTGVIVKTSTGANAFADLGGRKIVAIAGTTNEAAIKARIQQLQLNATLVPVKDREAAVAAVESGSADGFASDKLMLVGSPFKDPASLRILPDDLSFEPYGIVLPRGDATLRHAVNVGLAHIYRSGEISIIFGNWFAPIGLKPGILLNAMFVFGGLPD